MISFMIGGAAIDRLHAAIEEGLGHWVFQHIAVAAMQLHALVHNGVEGARYTTIWRWRPLPASAFYH